MCRSLKVGLGMFALVGTMALLAATTDGAPTPKKATKSKVKPAARLLVIMGDNFFSPQSIQVNPGDTVVWQNTGQVEHNVTLDGNVLPAFVLQPGETSQPMPINASVSYQDSSHTMMTGSITVGNAPQKAKAAAKKAPKKANKAPAKKAPAKKVPAKKAPKEKDKE